MKRQQSGLPTGTGDARLLLVLRSKPRTVEKPNVIILSDNPAQYPDRSALAKRILNTAVKSGSAEILVSPKLLDIGGHEFYSVRYRYPAEQAYEAAITGQLNGCEISFEFTAASRQELNQLLRSADTIRLTGARH